LVALSLTQRRGARFRFIAAGSGITFSSAAGSARSSSARRVSTSLEIATLKELLTVATANMAELREQLADMQSKIEQLQRDGLPSPPPNRKASAVKP
jgi:TolA-binding protein